MELYLLSFAIPSVLLSSMLRVGKSTSITPAKVVTARRRHKFNVGVAEWEKKASENTPSVGGRGKKGCAVFSSLRCATTIMFFSLRTKR